MYGDNMTTCVTCRFLNSKRRIGTLSHTNSDTSLMISYNYSYTETKTTTSRHNTGHATYFNSSLIKL